MPSRQQARGELFEQSDSTTTSSSENESISSGSSSSLKSIRLRKTFVPHPSDDSESSSSEHESGYRGAYRLAPQFSYHDDNGSVPTVQSRKVNKCRFHLLGGLACVLTILEDYRRFQSSLPILPGLSFPGSGLGVRGSSNRANNICEGSWCIANPWMGLGRHLVKLIPLCTDDKALSQTPLVRLLSILWSLLEENIMPIAKSKAYTRAVPRLEAKAMPNSVKAFKSIATALDLQTSKPIERLSDDDIDLFRLSHPALIYRIAEQTCNLDYGVTDLDLSDLVSDSWSHSVRFGNTPQLIEILGGRCESIVQLSLKNNRLSHMPTWSTILPNLETLDISHNPKLRYLPVKLLKTMPNLSKVRCRCTTLFNKDRDDVLSTEQTVPAVVVSRRLPTLVECAVTSFLKSRKEALEKLQEQEQESKLGRKAQERTDAPDLVDLPCHLTRLVLKSYICDVCDSVEHPPLTEMEMNVHKTNWVEGDKFLLQLPTMSGRDVNGQLRGRSLPFEGRMCLRCLHCYKPTLHGGRVSAKYYH